MKGIKGMWFLTGGVVKDGWGWNTLMSSQVAELKMGHRHCLPKGVVVSCLYFPKFSLCYLRDALVFRCRGLKAK